MAANPQQPSLSGFARALVQAGRLKENEAESFLSQAETNKTSLIEQLVSGKKATYLELAQFASDKFGYPLLDLTAFDDGLIPRNAVDRKLVAAHRVIPLYKRGNRLAIAIADPTNLRALDEIRFQTGLAVDPVIVEEGKLAPLVVKFAESVEDALKTLNGDDINLDFNDEQGQEKSEEANIEVDDAPVVRFIQKMLLDAIAEGASDIHFEPYEKSYRIRFRTDGILREAAAPPLVIKDKIASRIKVISRLNIAEKRVPQDGRMRLVLSKSRAIDFRVSTLPTMYGEKIVLRILDPSSATLGIDALGYDPDQKKTLLESINRPYGMILVTGPTGSGKTVSLYT
ncbi:MAG TPA: ATPase, T2SS/T4P/T4SS family, partial [Accumulibacter sp.]|nr:ATPase, T2SS/T4P/T4SS family [Accumulibacter sp.]